MLGVFCPIPHALVPSPYLRPGCRVVHPRVELVVAREARPGEVAGSDNGALVPKYVALCVVEPCPAAPDMHVVLLQETDEAHDVIHARAVNLLPVKIRLHGLLPHFGIPAVLLKRVKCGRPYGVLADHEPEGKRRIRCGRLQGFPHEAVPVYLKVSRRYVKEIDSSHVDVEHVGHGGLPVVYHIRLCLGLVKFGARHEPPPVMSS